MSVEDIRIPPDHWQDFCDEFAGRHRGWQVTISRADTPAPRCPPATPPTRLLGEPRPLREVRYTRLEEAAEVLITVGEDGGGQSFFVENVVDLFERRAGEADQGLRIDSGDGTTLLVEFRAPAAPETLDGIADTEL